MLHNLRVWTVYDTALGRIREFVIECTWVEYKWSKTSKKVTNDVLILRNVIGYIYSTGTFMYTAKWFNNWTNKWFLVLLGAYSVFAVLRM